MDFAKALSMPLAAAMLAFGAVSPPLDGVRTPTFQRAVEYDGEGRKIKAKQHPRHNENRRTKEWQDYAARVESTHRLKRDGSWNVDPRDDKYLHSHARAMRGLRQAIAA